MFIPFIRNQNNAVISSFTIIGCLTRFFHIIIYAHKRFYAVYTIINIQFENIRNWTTVIHIGRSTIT